MAQLPPSLAAVSRLLAARVRGTLTAGELRPASVLVPLVARPGGLALLLTRRTEEVASHQGQICFPGGTRDAGDRDLLATALRETGEELGIAAEAVEVLGALDDFPTWASPFLITPYVGYLAELPELRPHRAEVAEVLLPPLADLLAPGVYREEIWPVLGPTRPVAVYAWQGARIWGATARILRQFLELAGPHLPGGGTASGAENSDGSISIDKPREAP